MQKTTAKLQNNWWKIVRGVAHTRYPLSIHFNSILVADPEEDPEWWRLAQTPLLVEITSLSWGI